MTVYARGLKWGEGPRWRDGALWVSDSQGSRLWTDASGKWTATDVPATSNGLWFLPDGRLVGAMLAEQRIGVWTGERWDTYADLSALSPGPLGDMVGDAQGNLYVDDVAFSPAKGEAPRPGRLLFVGADGSLQVAAQDVEFPNGLALLDGGETLVVAETYNRRLLAFRVVAPGKLADRRVYADVAALAGANARPDGIWGTSQGVWVATLEGRQVLLIRDGNLITSIDTGTGCPIACCADGTRLFVTIADTGGQPLQAALAERAVATHVAVYDVIMPGA